MFAAHFKPVSQTLWGFGIIQEARGSQTVVNKNNVGSIGLIHAKSFLTITEGISQRAKSDLTRYNAES